MARPSQAEVIFRFIIDNSILLIVGAATALVWANLDLEHYTTFAHGPLHFAVNDIGMVFFFALATKEVYEATLPGGPLSSPRQAAVPVVAALGGMMFPAGIYVALVLLIGDGDLMRGWAIPCATDIAFSYLIARMMFAKGHPAIPFLLLLAIADDALGLIILAVFYPSGPVSMVELFAWLLPAIALAYAFRRAGLASFWWYVLGPGVMAWIGLHEGGIHPALALVPIVPFMPHEKVEIRLIHAPRTVRHHTMHHFEHWWKVPVQIVLFAFGLANAGVLLSSVGHVTWIIMVGLIVGKPLGIVLTTFVAERVGFRRAPGLSYNALVGLGITAGIGFTVALFFTTAAFPPGPILDEAKMGALLSFAAAPLALIAGRLLRVNRPS
ncbi:MAG: Na+/H+ antiporter NhaA [Vicinamibacterales bacterium]